MSESMALVGLDVHQAQSVAAVFDPLSGELSVQRLRGAPGVVVPGFLEQLGRPVRAVYEAGPTGFGLARAAADRGLDLRVIAPGSIPKAPGDRVKTDRRDAKRLVRLLAAGELSFSFVPSEADERFRDLVRCIDDARRDLMRSRHRLSKFLLRRGLRFSGRQWTQPYERWLGKLTFDDALSQAVFVDYCSSVEALAHRRRTLIAVLEDAVSESSHAPTIARCAAFAGSTRSRPPGCAPRSGASSGSQSPASCRGSSASCRASTAPTKSACRARSPRPGRRTHAGCSSRPPTTTAAPRDRRRSRGPPSRPGSARGSDRLARAASPARPLGASRPAPPQADRHRRGRLRARARRVLLGGGHPEVTSTPQPTRPAAAGARTSTTKAVTSPSTGSRTRAMGNPANRPGGARS